MSNEEIMNNISKREEDFLRSSLEQYRSGGGYVFGLYNGDIEKLISNYMAVNLSCFVKSIAHSKEKGHKRYSMKGKTYSL